MPILSKYSLWLLLLLRGVMIMMDGCYYSLLETPNLP